MNMDSDAVIKNISSCLELLVSENPIKGERSAANSTEDDSQFINFDQNLEKVVEVISKDPHLCKILNLYEPSKEQNSDECRWNFVLVCLAFLQKLADALLLLKQEDSTQCTDENSPPPGLLSIKQENSVKKCFLFVIGLGIMPNLIPDVRAALQRRTNFTKILSHLKMDFCLKKKYYRLTTCVSVVMECLKQTYFQTLLLTSHGGDLLIALFQLCFAPIKKTSISKDFQEKCQINATSSSNVLTEDELLEKNGLYQDLNLRMIKIRECCNPTDDEFISEMWDDREYFMLLFNRLLNQICPSILLWELLLLQGVNLKVSEDFLGAKRKLPLWFQKKSREIFTEKMMAPSGIKNFITVALDKMLDVDVETGVVSKQKIDAVARIIVMTPTGHFPIELYVERISSQILELLHTKGTVMDRLFSNVAANIILQLTVLNSDLAHKYIFRIIFQSFWKCLQLSKDNEDQAPVAANDITQSIEDAHQIFVLNTSVVNQEAIKTLFPLFHLLFVLYVKLFQGVLMIKSRVENLILAILDNAGKDDALALMEIATFGDVTVPNVQSATLVKCLLVDDGIQVVKNDHNLDDLYDEINDKCEAILLLINKVSDKKFKVSYFLFLLKRSISIETRWRNSCIEKDEVQVFLEQLVSTHLLSALSEQVEENCVSDLDESIEFISTAVSFCEASCESNSGETALSDEKLQSVLLILTTIIQHKSQLTHKHWAAMKKCLPSLEKLISAAEDPFVTDLGENICTAIKTHGAAFDYPSAKSVHQTFTNQKATKKDSLSEDIINLGKVGRLKSELIFQQSACSSTDTSKTKVENNLPTRPKIEVISSSVNSEAPIEKQQHHYDIAMNELNDTSLPTKGHGLLLMCKLLETKDKVAVSHLEDLLNIFKENLMNVDSYIYLYAIRGLSAVADINTELALPILVSTVTSETENFSEEKLDFILKIGEVFWKVCQNLGELTVKYRDILLNIFLRGTRHKTPAIRASSLVNLGEVCKRLKFSIGSSLQEVLLCVKSLLKTDPDIMVRRSAMEVLKLLLQGMGNNTFQILQDDIKDIYSLLRWTYYTEKDDTLKLQSQLALEEVNEIVKSSFNNTQTLTKEIRVCDPFV